MTDTPPVPPTPEQPATPPAPPAAPAAGTPAPGYAAAPGYAPAAPGPKQGLSLGGMITGIAAFLLSFIFGLGFIPGIVGLILSLMGRKREPAAPPAFWIVGVIASSLAIVSSLIWGLASVALFIFPFIIAGSSGGFS